MGKENSNIADELFAKMNENAEVLVPRLLTKEVWEEEIANKSFQSPIGTVKLGENQYEKNKGNKREKEFGMIIPTIERPDFIFEEFAPEKDAKRQSKYVFTKAFLDNEGNRIIYYASVLVMKDSEVVMSSHYLRENQVRNKIKKEQILWNRFASDSMSSAQGSSTDQSNASSVTNIINNFENPSIEAEKNTGTTPPFDSKAGVSFRLSSQSDATLSRIEQESSKTYDEITKIELLKAETPIEIAKNKQTERTLFRFDKDFASMMALQNAIKETDIARYNTQGINYFTTLLIYRFICCIFTQYLKMQQWIMLKRL